jgi:L-arabinonolactonase
MKCRSPSERKQMNQAELVIDCGNVLGEGVTWNAAGERLHWVDIESSEMWTLDPASSEVSTHRAPERITCLAPRRSGDFVAGFASGFAFYDPASGARKNLASFEPEKPTTRLNDGRTDRQGRLVAGGFDEKNGAFISSVVRLDPDRRVTTLFEGIACANGICFSPDGRTMYFADSPARKIWTFDYDTESGGVSNRRELSTFDAQPGLPDGSCVDADGCIWNAQWNGRRVVRYTPDGRVDRIVPVPVPNPTCVTFGGAQLDVLYITTARYLMTSQQILAEPLSGALFAIAPGVKGLPDAAFAA